MALPASPTSYSEGNLASKASSANSAQIQNAANWSHAVTPGMQESHMLHGAAVLATTTIKKPECVLRGLELSEQCATPNAERCAYIRGKQSVLFHAQPFLHGHQQCTDIFWQPMLIGVQPAHLHSPGAGMRVHKTCEP